MSAEAVLLITTSYPQTDDGSEAAGAFVADLAAELARRRPVRVVAPGRTEAVLAAREGVEVRTFAAPGRPLSLLSPGNPGHWLSIASTLASLRRQSLRAAEDGQLRHSLAFWALPSGWAARSVQRKHAVPYSVWALGSDIWSLGRLPIVRGVLGGVIRGATHRYADGVGLAREAERVAGTAVEFLPSSRIRSGRRIRPLNDAPPYRLMFLGRWHENKGVDLLLQALGMLDEETWSRIGAVHIAGGGPLEERVRTGCECLVAQGRPVRLSGFLGRIEAEHMLAEADYLLLPSRVESIPLVFSDALKFGLPIIANPVGDLPDLLTPAEGFIAEAATAEAFARSISIAMHASASSYAPAITELARTFSLPDVAARLETTFRSPDAT